MNGGRCASCSEPPRRGCHCGRVPTNLAFVQSVLNKPNTRKRRKCARKCTSCVVVAAGGDSVDCLCNIDITMHKKSDHRLQCWERELQLRNSIAERLMQRTGKSCCELLFNRPVTVDVRDKLTMQRLLAHAESRKPRAHHKKAIIKEQLPGVCYCLKEISSAKPTAKKYFEISGLPAGVKCELIGENCCVRRSGWLTSRTIQAHIAAKGSDIKRVLPFFPEIEYLQVIGKKMTIYNGSENDETNQIECPCCSHENDETDIYNGNENDETNQIECPCCSHENDETDQTECPCCSPDSASFESCEALHGNICDCDARLCGELNENADADQLAMPLGCSDSDFDYYSELICNRARCHELFYKL